MALLDPVFDFLTGIASFIDDVTDTVDDLIEGITNPQFNGEQFSEIASEVIEDITPADEVGAVLVDTVEEFILSDLQDAGQLTPDNVESQADQLEGGATAVLAGVASSSSLAEAAGLGQLDTHSEFLTEALAGLSVTEVTGLELEARTQEGIRPALEAKVNADHRAKFADLVDVVEADLRNKDRDEGYTRNLATYGIRPQDVPILEEAAISEIEFEELLETPSELGLPVPEEILREELDRAGYAEATKDFLSETAAQIPRSARAYQELLVSEELVPGLDTLVENGVLSPSEAVNRLPEEVPADRAALRRRYEDLAGLPGGSPSQSEVESALAQGRIDLSEAESLLDMGEVDPETYPWVLRAALWDELDGDLQEALGTGLITETQYASLAEVAGVDDGVVSQLLQGKDKGDITQEALAQGTTAGEASVETLIGIGPDRAAGLEAAGIETVSDMASAEAEAVSQAAQVSPETAQEFIAQASQRVQ